MPPSRLIFRSLAVSAITLTGIGLLAAVVGWHTVNRPRNDSSLGPDQGARPALGSTAPSLPLRFIDGARFDLDETLKNSPVVIEFLCLS